MRGPLAQRLGILFAMGGTQGLVGWWMVRSGLEVSWLTFEGSVQQWSVAIAQSRQLRTLNLSYMVQPRQIGHGTGPSIADFLEVSAPSLSRILWSKN